MVRERNLVSLINTTMGEDDIPFEDFKNAIVHHYGKIRAFYFLTKEFDLYDVDAKITSQSQTAIEIDCKFKSVHSKKSFIDYIEERIVTQIDDEVNFEFVDIDNKQIKLIVSMDSEEVMEIC